MMKASVKTRNNAASITRRVVEAKRDWLDQFGKDVATEAAAIQKESAFASQPGAPPSVHSPSPNLETFAHVVSDQGDSVKAGPVHLPSKGITPALPGVLERGGYVVKRRRTGKNRNPIRMYIKKRPFVLPAAKRALIKFRIHVQGGV